MEAFKKFLVLGILFIFPLVIYLFFASGINNFARLPILTEEVSEINTWPTLQGTSHQFDGMLYARFSEGPTTNPKTHTHHTSRKFFYS